MNERDSAKCRPLLSHLFGNQLALWQDFFLVRLVRQCLDTRSTVGMVSNSARKNHHGTATGQNRPVVSLINAEWFGRQLQQRVAVVDEAAKCHDFSVPEVADDLCEQRLTILWQVMGDDERNDEGTGNFFNAPLPPYDREWRHPSELSDVVEPSVNYGLGRSVVRGIVFSTAIISVCLSVAVLQVVTPASRLPESRPTTQNAALAQPLPLAAMPKTARISGRIIPVLAISESGFFIAGASDLQVGSELHVITDEGIDVLVQVVKIDDAHGLAWLHAVDSVSHRFIPIDDNLPVPTTIVSATTGDLAWLMNDSQALSIAIGISSGMPRQPDDMWPVNNLGRPIRPGVVVDDRGNMIGICVNYNGSHWIVPTEAIVQELHRLESNVEQS